MQKKLFPWMWLLALILLVGAFGLVGCTKKQIDGEIHWAMWENPKSLDPVQASEQNVLDALDPVYEPLYQYHYLKRPYELTPLLAASMPQYSKDGLTITIKIRRGILFQDDPCFKDGKGREVTAEDFIYQFKRIADTKNISDGWWIFDSKIVGLNEWRDAQAKLPKTDYSAPVAGFQAPDPYTLVIKLKKKYPQLNFILAMEYTAPVPFEAVDKYGADFAFHPVGTGAYVLTDFSRSSYLKYERNPHYHDQFFPMPVGRTPAQCAESKDPTKSCSVDGVSGSDFDYGKKLPFTDKITIHISLEKQPLWLKFVSGQLDWFRIFKDNFTSALTPERKLVPELAKKGINHVNTETTTYWWITFNMADPAVGGAKNKALRQAMALAYDAKKNIELFIGGAAVPIGQILPPSIMGYNPKIPPKDFNVEKAKAILAKAGHPGGKGIPTLAIDQEGSSEQRQLGEFFKAQMAQIGINIEIRPHSRPELFDMRKKAKVQIYWEGWGMDYPDAENYLQLLYGPNKSPGSNNSNFQNAEYDKLYEQVAGMTPSPARQKLIDRMTEIWRDETPWIPVRVDTYDLVTQGWLKNYLRIEGHECNFKYYRVDLEKKKELMKFF